MAETAKLPEAPQRWWCSECREVTAEGDGFLTAPHPFIEGEVIGCPRCRDVGTLSAACCVKDCNHPANAGIPGHMGFRYAWVCSKHARPTGG